MKFSIISILIPLAGLLAAGCSSSRVASTEYDDVYYSSRDVTQTASARQTTYPEYRSEATGQAVEGGNLNPEYSGSSAGNTYVTNNYQTEYYRQDYMGNRFDPMYRPSAYQLNYWHVPYNNYYWYDPFAPNFNLAVHSYPFYHRHYGWYDSPFMYGGFGYPVRPGLTVHVGFGYYNYWGWNPYNYWGGYYGGFGHPGFHNGYYRGFHDGFYASGGNRRTATHYGRRQERSVVPTSAISAPGGRVTPMNRPGRDGRIDAGGRQTATPGTQPAMERTNVAPAIREERGIKTGREIQSDQQMRQEAVPATEAMPARRNEAVPVRESGIKPERQLNEQARPAEQRSVPSEVRPARQEPGVRPENYQFQEQQARPAIEAPARSNQPEYVPSRNQQEQLSRPESPANVQPERYSPAPERPVNVRPEQPANQAQPSRQQERPVQQRQQPAPRQIQERPAQQRSPAIQQSRPAAPARQSQPANNSGSRMRPRN